MTRHLLENPTLEEARKVVKEALEHRQVVLVIGRCSVDYKGRARSTLELGERILIIKKDGSLLIHRASGWKPVNWQPPGCQIEISTESNQLRIRAVRQRPPETIVATFDQLILVTAMTLMDSGQFSLDASEADMQRAIILLPEIVERGFRVVEHERRIEPGFVDVYGIDSQGRLVVIEIKRKPAGKEAIFQLLKYVKATMESSGKPIRAILVAPSIARGTQRLLETAGVEFRRLNPKECARILEEAGKEQIGRLNGWI